MIQPTFLITEESVDQNQVTLVFEPLEKGYGHTLGNALRRVMLSSLDGVAITSVKIAGVSHQFSTLEGLSENIVEFILNLKEVRLKTSAEGPFSLILDVKNKKQAIAGDIEVSGDLEVVNKDLVLAVLDPKTHLYVEITAERGSGYSMVSERKTDSIGVIPVDALFSPVVRVAYEVETTRVGRKTDFDKLVMHVWTDGTLTSKQALEHAAKILVAQFQQIYDPVVVSHDDQTESQGIPQTNQLLKLTVEELDLPTRIANALRRGGYKTIEDLTNADKETIAKVKNLGEKSVLLVEESLNKRGFSIQG